MPGITSFESKGCNLIIQEALLKDDWTMPGLLGGGFEYFLFSSLIGEMLQFD